MKVLSATQIYEADRLTLAHEGISSYALMERAAKQACLHLQINVLFYRVPIHIICGMGNNGGDGLVLARCLHQSGYSVHTYVVKYTKEGASDFQKAWMDYVKETGKEPIHLDPSSSFPVFDPSDILIDCVFGIGINRAVTGWLSMLFKHLNASKAKKISIDIPSGLFPDEPTPDISAIFHADYTLTFQVPKLAFFLPDNEEVVHEWDVLDIGLHPEFLESAPALATLTDAEQAAQLYRPRSPFSHKGTFGHGLVVGGSYGMLGAVVLSASAALRSGAGLVSVFIPQCGYSVLQTTLPEAMVLTDKEEDYISDIVFDFEPAAIGIGVGMGKNQMTQHAFLGFLKKVKSPLVIDADALNILAENEELLSFLPKRSILTPHPGELRRLIGAWKNDFEKIETAKQFSKKHDVVLLIKGAHTLVIDGDSVFINTTGNPGMSTAGSVDVLTGVLTSLMAQGYDSLSASRLGVYVHGCAGDLALKKKGEEGLIARDIIAELGKAFKKIASDAKKDSFEGLF